jgi:hypothetical protein
MYMLGSYILFIFAVIPELLCLQAFEDELISDFQNTSCKHHSQYPLKHKMGIWGR